MSKRKQKYGWFQNVIFMSAYSITEKDRKRLEELFSEYGIKEIINEDKRNPSDHHYLQAILYNNSIEWEQWNASMSDKLRDIIKNEYPRLMVQDQTYAIKKK